MLAPGSTVLYVTPPERRAFRDGPFEVRAGVSVERLSDGTYQVNQIEDVGEQTVQEIVDWAEVEDGAGSILLQRKGKGVVCGRVEFEGAAPAKPVQVSAHRRSPPGEAPVDPAQRTPQFGALTVDGAFEITHLVPGRYSLRAFQQGLGWVALGGAQATVLDGQSVEVDLTLIRTRR